MTEKEKIDQLERIFAGALTEAVDKNWFGWTHGLTEPEDVPSLARFLAESLRGSRLLK